MKRAKIVLGFLLVLTLGLSLSVNLSEAEQLDGLITIQSDGSVVPQTEYIKQEGNVYYLTQNLSAHRLDIYCSNIVLDGQGYTINGSNYYVFGGKGITLENINNVTIRDVMVVGYFEPSISLSNCSNITILRVHTDEKPDIIGDISDCIYLDGNSNGNIISNCVGGVRVQSGSGNTICGNNVTLFINTPNNLIYYNNIEVNYYLSRGVNATPYPIIGIGASFNRWDNGIVGNYWSDYKGQGVYELDKNNIDQYPLTQRVAIPSIVNTPTTTPIVPEFSWLMILLLLLSVIAVAVLIRKSIANASRA